MTYEKWARVAKMLDKETIKMNEAYLYDVELVRNKLQELCRRRQEESFRDIIFCMRADLVRNLGNVCNRALHQQSIPSPPTTTFLKGSLCDLFIFFKKKRKRKIKTCNLC